MLVVRYCTNKTLFDLRNAHFEIDYDMQKRLNKYKINKHIGNNNLFGSYLNGTNLNGTKFKFIRMLKKNE